MNGAHRKILNAVLQKAERVCPGSLELIGLYGSCATGDTSPWSDLDLLILIRDESGTELAEGFVLDDTGIGYDLYCTTWDSLEADARCSHAHLSKLLDASLLYVRDPASAERLAALRQKAHSVLESDARYEKAAMLLEEAKKAFADCFLTDSLSGIRKQAGRGICLLLDGLMLYHGRYFRMGVKRTFAELSELSLPFAVEDMVMDVIRAPSAGEIRAGLTELLKAAAMHMTLPAAKEEPCPVNLSGTYEEMVSNWHGKMEAAAENNDLFSSFMSMVSCQFMLDDIAASVSIGRPDLLASFDPQDTARNAAAFEEMLCQYREEYRRAGIQPKHFADADAFVAEYLSAVHNKE